MKKNLIILVAVLLTSTFAFAQSGKMFVTGNLDFNTNNTTRTTVLNSTTTETILRDGSNFGINASFHYKVIDNLAVGLGLGYNTTRVWTGTFNNKEVNDYTNLFNITPSAIYFIEINDKFQFTPELFFNIGFGGANYQFYNVANDNVEDFTASTFGFGVGIIPLSFNYNMNDNLALAFSLGEISYSNQKTSIDEPAPFASNESVNGGFNLQLNSGFRIGLRYFF
ncbi:MAG: hypothetical protein PHN41_07350 [Bacteroidales bacterium]|nr:hypothetical protein [Bacteroidales bacterium]